MPLTQKQQKAMNAAPQKKRAGIRAGFQQQNASSGGNSRNSQMRSIPKVVRSRNERFTHGAPSTTSTFAARGHGYYDAFTNAAEALVLASQVGPCTPVEGFTRLTLAGHAGVTDKAYESITGLSSVYTTGLTDNTSLIVLNPGASDRTVGRIYKLGVSASNASHAAVVKTDIDVTAFADLGPVIDTASVEYNYQDGPATAGVASNQGPTGRVESIPLRGSVRMRNVTEAVAVGGEVRVLRFNGGLALGHDVPTSHGTLSPDMGVAEYVSICEMMRETKRTHSFDGAELRTTHQSNTYPADLIRAMTFQTDVSFSEACARPGYCTLLILIDDFRASSTGLNNTYSLGINVQKAARFTPGTLLHSKQIQPGADSNTHAMVTQIEVSKPSLHRVADAYASVSKFANTPMVQSLMPYIASGAKAAWRKAQAMRMLPAGAGAVEGAGEQLLRLTM